MEISFVKENIPDRVEVELVVYRLLCYVCLDYLEIFLYMILKFA